MSRRATGSPTPSCCRPVPVRFEHGPSLTDGRYKLTDAVVALPDGRVVVGGGPTLDVLDVRARHGPDARRAADSTYAAPSRRSAVVSGSRVLVAGGYDDAIRPDGQHLAAVHRPNPADVRSSALTVAALGLSGHASPGAPVTHRSTARADARAHLDRLGADGRRRRAHRLRRGRRHGHHVDAAGFFQCSARRRAPTATVALVAGRASWRRCCSG